jgi:type I restriction enzyme S subunit
MHVSDRALQNTAIKLIPQKAVVFVVRGMILARKIPVAVLDVVATINQDMKALILNSAINPYFFSHLFESSWGSLRNLIDEAGHGTKRFPSERWRNYQIALPPISEQHEIMAYIEKKLRQIEETLESSSSCVACMLEYRTRLISDVVTGKLDVRAAAARLPEAVPPAPSMDDDDLDEELAEDETVDEEAEE